MKNKSTIVWSVLIRRLVWWVHEPADVRRLLSSSANPPSHPLDFDLDRVLVLFEFIAQVDLLSAGVPHQDLKIETCLIKGTD